MESVQTELNLNGLEFPDKETELTELEKKVFDLIPLGKENAVTGSYIATTLKIGERTLTDTVKKMRLKHYDIGSTTNDGYWRFKNPQEYMEYMNKAEKEHSGRGKVIEAMRLTPMARKITAEMNQTAKQKTRIKEQ
ncbi:hypothetical protein [Lactobacillus kitasatonis]|uniref:hypothetical protein n=1 Tax=Lactobacillus kitasatonis TaxID=237446 RepID=UPI003F66140A